MSPEDGVPVLMSNHWHNRCSPTCSPGGARSSAGASASSTPPMSETARDLAARCSRPGGVQRRHRAGHTLGPTAGRWSTRQLARPPRRGRRPRWRPAAALRVGLALTEGWADGTSRRSRRRLLRRVTGLGTPTVLRMRLKEVYQHCRALDIVPRHDAYCFIVVDCDTEDLAPFERDAARWWWPIVADSVPQGRDPDPPPAVGLSCSPADSALPPSCRARGVAPGSRHARGDGRAGLAGGPPGPPGPHRELLLDLADRCRVGRRSSPPRPPSTSRSADRHVNIGFRMR